jgi:hypothetical protein
MDWYPVSGCEEFNGCVWLPRLISKARRVVEIQDGNRIGEYMFGENDPADAELLRFLGLSAQQILELVQNESNDEVAATQILALSGKSAAKCAKFSRKFRILLGPFLAMMDADEYRTGPGFRTALLRFVYNRIVMPPAYLYFHWKERRARAPAMRG